MTPSMPALRPDPPQASWSVSQMSMTSLPVAMLMVLPNTRRRHYPTPIGPTPGHLSSGITRLAISAQMSFQSTTVLAIRRVRAAKASLKCELYIYIYACHI